MKKIPLIKPYINSDIKDMVCEVLNSGYLTEGPLTKEFEAAIQNHVGCRNAISVTSCTTGLEMALRVLGVSPGDEVIVPDYTYPATAAVVSIVGATLVLVDVSPESMLIDYDCLEAAITDKTKAVIPVSLFGNPLDWDRLNAIKTKYNLFMIEDAACSLGAEYKGDKIGNLADISVFSHHPRKFITTGEGGTITTNNDDWASWMESYKHFGMRVSSSREGTIFELIGTNYKLSNLLAAVGLGQMRCMDSLFAQRIALADRYNKMLREMKWIIIPKTTSGGKHSYQSFCIFLENRNPIMDALRANGIEVQIGTYALHMHPAFTESTTIKHHGSFNGSRYAFDHCLTLPLFHEMTEEEQHLVISRLKDEYSRQNE